MNSIRRCCVNLFPEMKKLLPLVLFSLLTGFAWADDQTRQIQSALSEAGFYYGTADGIMSDDTRAALRRFQIRNGLDVTGETSPETFAALKLQKKETPNAAARDEQQIVSTAKKPEAFLAPPARQAPPAVGPGKAAPSAQWPARSPIREYFSGTDLVDSPADEQSTALLNAQKQLVKLGYLRSAPDGLPGPEMDTALLRFQYACQLRLTGRLDADTRHALVDAPPSVPGKSFRRSENRPPGRILRGFWVH